MLLFVVSICGGWEGETHAETTRCVQGWDQGTEMLVLDSLTSRTQRHRVIKRED